MKKSLLTVCMITTLAAGASAGNLDKGDISPNARWAAHLDMTKLRSTKVWELIQAAPKADHVAAKIQLMKSTLGFDPMADLTDITLYGDNHKQGQGVAVVRGSIPVEQLTTLIKANDTHGEVAYGSYTIHTWKEAKKGNKQAQGCILDNQTMIFAGTMGDLKKAIDIVANGAASLADDSSSVMPNPSEDAIFFFHTDELKGELANNPHANITRNAKSLTFAVAETDAQLDMELRMKAGSAEEAQKMTQVVTGILAFMSLAAEANPEAAEIAGDVVLEADGDVVRMGLSRPSEKVYEMLKRHHEMKMKLRAMRHRRSQSSTQPAE